MKEKNDPRPYKQKKVGGKNVKAQPMNYQVKKSKK